MALVTVVALATAACSGGSGQSASTDVEEDRRSTTSTSPVVEEPEEDPAPSAEEVADAVDSLFSESGNTGNAHQDYAELSAMTVAAAAAADDPADVFAAAEEAVLWAYEGDQTAEAAARIDAALAGTATTVEYVEPKRGDGAVLRSAGGSGGSTEAGKAAISEPALKVYYVNGVNNTLSFARGLTARLVQVLGHDVVHYYNPSTFNPRQYTEDWCARALMTLLAERRQSAHLAQLEGDAAIEEVLQAADEGEFSWLVDPVRTAVGLDRSGIHALKNAGFTAAEYAAAAACSQVDAIKETFERDVRTGVSRFLVEWLANTMGVVKNRLEVATGMSAHDRELVELVKRDISQGRRVVLLGHSHGTMIVRLALAELNRWYMDEVVGECPDGRTAADIAPVAGIYVSPGFEVDADDQQYPVMVRGDFLGLTRVGHTPNVEPTGDQVERGPIGRHSLRSYLEDGTHTQALIQWSFENAAYRVTSVPDADRACGESPPTVPIEEFSPIDGPHWRLLDPLVNPDGYEDPGNWTAVDVSPGHVAVTQVDEEDEPRFAAVYDVNYDLPPQYVELGSEHEIGVTVDGQITLAETNRHTRAEVVRVQNGYWKGAGAVGVRQTCGHEDGELVCDPPASTSGSLPFSAPSGGETFEFTITLLNCSACNVTFRYELVE